MLENSFNFFKNQFRHIIFYSMPNSILFILNKKIERIHSVSKRYRKALVAEVSPYSTKRDLFVTQN